MSQLFSVSLSVFVSTLTLPLYFRAEKWANLERDVEKRLAPKIKTIKSVFRGDEQFMLLSTYYRQNNYHPLYAFRNMLYEGGAWLSGRDGGIPLATINGYVALDELPSTTTITESNANTFAIIANNLTHAPAFLQAPDYTIPDGGITTNKGAGPFALEDHYHVNMAAMLLLGKYFDYLRDNDVYDNTRIILVSDHGRNAGSRDRHNITLPNGEELESYNCLLMVKDFDTRAPLRTDNRFMVNADTPLLALDGLVAAPVNPYTGKEMRGDKENGVTITTSGGDEGGEYTYLIKNDEWLHVRDNIFDVANWRIEIEK